MALEFESMAPAGKFGDTCETAILDLRPYVPDEVLANIPRFFGRWEDGNQMDILLDENYGVTAADDSCSFLTFDSEVLSCTVLIPNQKRIAAGVERVDYMQLLKRFCDAKRLERFPTLFNSDGSFNTGAPLSGLFMEYLWSDLKSKYMAYLRDVAWNGDQDTQDQFEGILSQLDTPLVPSSSDGCEQYRPVTLNWGSMTGGGSTTPVHPSATITSDQDVVTIHGHDFDGMSGANLVQFLVLWIERLLEYDLAPFDPNTIQFELWVGRGQKACIAELAACMQPCDGCVNPMSDPQIRARAAEFRRDGVIWLYPYDNIPIVLRQTPVLKDQMILVPKMIGGRPTIGWVFRDQEQQQAILNGEMPYYGAQVGSPDYSALYRTDEVDEAAPFEERAFSINVQKGTNCLDYWINSESAIVIMAMHLWMRIQNVDCNGLVPSVYNDMGITASACATDGLESNQLQLTVADLEAYGTVSAGDTYAIHFEDLITVLIGTVVSYNTGTDELVLEFSEDVTCNTGGGAANAIVVKLAEN